jgi:4-hydroxy-4-methyl-2-oxoglutarate aldolase
MSTLEESAVGNGQNRSGPARRGDLASLYRLLRVVDVCDALDGIGYFDVGLVSPEVRPLWTGMKFWGPAATIRLVAANRPMWKLGSTEEIVRAHGVWFNEVGRTALPDDAVAGHVVVTDSGGSKECGFWGSENSLGNMARGAVGIVTDGYCRDTAEVTLQKTPICARARGRTIIPGRVMVAEVQGTIACGGAQVRPGDIVGCDDDGVVVVPVEVAEQVAEHARAILLADMRARRKHYERLGLPMDNTVDFEAAEKYYADV